MDHTLMQLLEALFQQRQQIQALLTENATLKAQLSPTSYNARMGHG